MRRTVSLFIAILCLHGIAAPTRSGMSAMHTRFIEEEEAQPWYVTEGLNVHFDGIYNVGYGQHESSAIRWLDLVNGFYYPISVSYDDCISIVGTDAVRYPNVSEVSFTLNHDMTLHTVVTTPSRVTWDMQALIALGRDSFSKNGFVLGGVAGYGTFQAYWKSSYSGGTAYYVDTGVGANAKVVVDIVFVYNSLQFVVYVNGIQCSSVKEIDHSVWNLDGKTDIRLRMGSSGGALNDASGFRSHSIMLYDRALSDEEVQWNYTLDKERFDL